MEDRNFRILHQRLNEEEKKIFRKHEDSIKKTINATEAIVFNENCIREKLCPKSIYIYIYIYIYIHIYIYVNIQLSYNQLL